MSEPVERPDAEEPRVIAESAAEMPAEESGDATGSATAEPAEDRAQVPHEQTQVEQSRSAELDPGFVQGSRRASQVGTVLALVSLLAAVVGPFLSFAGFGLWPLLTVATSLVMVAVCGLQYNVWTKLARAEESVWKLQTASWAGHLLSYLLAVLGLIATLVSMSEEGPLSVAFWVHFVAGLTLLLAQSTAAVQYLRRVGPPGTIPAHIRRLVDATTRLGS